ncbi:homeobox protein Hox-D13-like [Salvelinus alpinus]|uniref:homeobox protein Hox-D13-like n=1 Tax=Salvelinus alpinus TaxID=8036 RepID=UPI0039FCBB8F
MEGLGDNITSVHRRCFYSSAPRTNPSRSVPGVTVYTISDKPNYFGLESLKPYSPLSTIARNASLTFDCHLGSSCYGCTIPDSNLFQQGVMKPTSQASLSGHSSDKPMHFSGFSSSNIHCSEMQSRLKDVGNVYQGYTGLYPRISGYIDVPVVTWAGPGDPRHEDYQQLNWANSWSNPLYYAREQKQGSQFWKSSLTEEAVMNQPDVCTSYRRGRKKRVPYTKLQLKELEREYTICKFITKEKRQRIASSTNLSERQVTIWFQNRRVKNKKLISKDRDLETFS